MLEDLEAADEISSQADRLLRAADACGRFPTPVNDLVRASQLSEADDYVLDESLINKAPVYLRTLLRSARHKIQGIIDRRARVIHISPAIDHEDRRRFVKMHETAHHILPHQQDLLYAEDHETLPSHEPPVRAGGQPGRSRATVPTRPVRPGRRRHPSLRGGHPAARRKIRLVISRGSPALRRNPPWHRRRHRPRADSLASGPPHVAARGNHGHARVGQPVQRANLATATRSPYLPVHRCLGLPRNVQCLDEGSQRCHHRGRRGHMPDALPQLPVALGAPQRRLLGLTQPRKVRLYQGGLGRLRAPAALLWRRPIRRLEESSGHLRCGAALIDHVPVDV